MRSSFSAYFGDGGRFVILLCACLEIIAVMNSTLAATNRKPEKLRIKDGAYYCHWAYVLRISRYSDFLSPMLTYTGIFLRGLKLSGESRS